MLLNTHDHLVSAAPQSQLLHVISVVSNPVGYNQRYKLYEQFVSHMRTFKNVHLVTVELALGERAFETTARGDSNFRFRTWDELWHKENLINLGIARLPEDWQYVAWIDGDIAFTNPHWVNQTLQELQSKMVLQLFENAIDLGPNGQFHQQHTSLTSLYAQGKPLAVNSDYGYGTFGHPGFAWAARREAIDGMGGLIDWAALGSGDHHMSLAFIGQVEKSMPGGLHPAYVRRAKAFQAQTERYIRRDIGFTPGTLTHFWHGKKDLRGYQSRWGIIQKNQYDPDHDIKPDSQGVLQLVDHGDHRSIQLRDDIRRYFRSRNEDGIDL